MAKNNSKFATLGLVAIVAVVGVVGLITLLQQGSATTVKTVPVQTAQPTANSGGQGQNIAGQARRGCTTVWSGDKIVGIACAQGGIVEDPGGTYGPRKVEPLGLE